MVRARHGAAVGLALRRREAAVRPDGRGVRGVPEPRRPRARPAAGLPARKAASSTTPSSSLVSDNGASGEGGPERLGEREQVLQRPARHDRGEPEATSTSSAAPLTYNHYPTGWAWAFNTPFKMWKRYANYEGGTADPMIVSWPRGITARRDPRRQYTPRGRHRADAVRVPRRRAARRRQGLHAEPARGRQLPLQLRRRRRARRGRRRSSTRCSARGQSGTRAGRPPPRCRPRPTRGATSTAEVGAVRHRGGSERVPRPRRAAPGEAAGAGRAVVGGGGPAPGAAARVPRRGGDPRDRAPAAREAASRYVYYPGCAEVPESVAPNIRNRSYTSPPRWRSRRPRPAACSSPKARGSAATPSTSRTASSSTSTTGSASSCRSSNPTSRSRPATSSSRPRSRRRATRCPPRAR